MENSANTKNRKKSTLMRPLTDLINAATCLRRLGMVFMAFKGLSILKVLSARMLKFCTLNYCMTISMMPAITMTKSSTFQYDFR